jgi:hypothetical protein
MSFNSSRDLQLKFLCKILFDAMGYQCLYEIKLRTKSYIQALKVHDVSDIDLFGYTFQPDMTIITIGAECKSGDSNALDELYKFIGIRDYANLNRGYFIKTKIHQNARQIAYQRGISCFSEAELRKLLLGFGIDLDKQLSIESAKYSRLMTAIKEYKKFEEKLVDYILYGFWNKDNWKNIHNIIHFLSTVSQRELFPGNNINHKIFHYYLTECLCFSILKNIHMSMMINYSDIEEALKNSLYGGADALSEKQKLYDMVNQALGQNQSFSPHWESDFINMSARFAARTKDSSRIPSLLQNIRENAFYKDKMSIKPSLLKNYSDITRKFTQDLMSFVTNTTGLPIEIYEEFMSL